MEISCFCFFGNQPFLTRSSCLKSSPIDQSEQKPATANTAEAMTFATKTLAAMSARPNMRNAGQQRFEKWYSALMTIGWKTPIAAKALIPMMMPVVFILAVVRLLSSLAVVSSEVFVAGELDLFKEDALERRDVVLLVKEQ